jgi:hypothetical protein
MTKEGCDYYRNHVRFHSSDVRGTNTIVNKFFRIIRYMSYSSFYDKNNYLPILTLLTEQFKKLQDNEIYKKLIYDNFRSSKSYKQIENIENENISKIILQEIDKLIGKQIKIYTYDNIVNFLNELILGKNSDRLREKYKIQEFYLDGTVIDMYILGRMFRTFKNPKSEYSLINKSEPSNIIIYVGAVHCKFYEKILEKLKFKTIHKSEKVNDNYFRNCLSLGDFEYTWI